MYVHANFLFSYFFRKFIDWEGKSNFSRVGASYWNTTFNLQVSVLTYFTRWGFQPIDDARRFNHHAVVKILEEVMDTNKPHDELDTLEDQLDTETDQGEKTDDHEQNKAD